MTDAEIQDFVTRFAAAWAARDGKAFLDLWHPEGLLQTPMVGRAVKGSELDRLMEVQKAAAPDFVWQLLDWTSRGDVVIIEWQTTRVVNGTRFDWRGVDKFRLQDRQDHRGAGLYRHRAAARRSASGEKLEPITQVLATLAERAQALGRRRRTRPVSAPPAAPRSLRWRADGSARS